MKKTISILAAAALILAAMPMKAYGRCHGGRIAAANYSLCSTEDCDTAGLHKHDGTYYCGHYIGDGHDYHQICSVQDCTKSVNHQHDGVTCFPHANGDGHSYHKLKHCGAYYY